MERLHVGAEIALPHPARGLAATAAWLQQRTRCHYGSAPRNHVWTCAAGSRPEPAGAQLVLHSSEAGGHAAAGWSSHPLRHAAPCAAVGRITPLGATAPSADAAGTHGTRSHAWDTVASERTEDVASHGLQHIGTQQASRSKAPARHAVPVHVDRRGNPHHHAQTAAQPSTPMPLPRPQRPVQQQQQEQQSPSSSRSYALRHVPPRDSHSSRPLPTPPRPPPAHRQGQHRGARANAAPAPGLPLHVAIKSAASLEQLAQLHAARGGHFGHPLEVAAALGRLPHTHEAQQLGQSQPLPLRHVPLLDSLLADFEHYRQLGRYGSREVSSCVWVLGKLLRRQGYARQLVAELLVLPPPPQAPPHGSSIGGPAGGARPADGGRAAAPAGDGGGALGGAPGLVACTCGSHRVDWDRPRPCSCTGGARPGSSLPATAAAGVTLDQGAAPCSSSRCVAGTAAQPAADAAAAASVAHLAAAAAHAGDWGPGGPSSRHRPRGHGGSAPAPNPTDLANIAHGLARLAIPDPRLWQAVAEAALPQLASFQPQELASLLWGLAHALRLSRYSGRLPLGACSSDGGEEQPSSGKAAEPQVGAGARRSAPKAAWPKHRDGLRLRLRASNGWAAGPAGQAAASAAAAGGLQRWGWVAAFVSHAAAAVAACLPALSSQQLANTSWALATLASHGRPLGVAVEPPVLLALASDVARRRQGLSPAAVSQVAWALGVLQPPPPAAQVAASALAYNAVRCGRRFTPQGLSNTVWGLHALGLRDRFAAYCLTRGSVRQLAQLHPLGLATVLTALASWRLFSRQLFTAAAGAALARLDAFAPATLARLLCALGSFNWAGPAHAQLFRQAAVPLLLGVASGRTPSGLRLPPSVCAIPPPLCLGLACAYARFGVHAPPLMDRLLDGLHAPLAAQQVPPASQLQLLLALAALGHRQPAGAPAATAAAPPAPAAGADAGVPVDSPGCSLPAGRPLAWAALRDGCMGGLAGFTDAQRVGALWALLRLDATDEATAAQLLRALRPAMERWAADVGAGACTAARSPGPWSRRLRAGQLPPQARLKHQEQEQQAPAAEPAHALTLARLVWSLGQLASQREHQHAAASAAAAAAGHLHRLVGLAGQMMGQMDGSSLAMLAEGLAAAAAAGLGGRSEPEAAGPTQPRSAHGAAVDGPEDAAGSAQQQQQQQQLRLALLGVARAALHRLQPLPAAGIAPDDGEPSGPHADGAAFSQPPRPQQQPILPRHFCSIVQALSAAGLLQGRPALCEALARPLLQGLSAAARGRVPPCEAAFLLIAAGTLRLHDHSMTCGKALLAAAERLLAQGPSGVGSLDVGAVEAVLRYTGFIAASHAPHTSGALGSAQRGGAGAGVLPQLRRAVQLRAVQLWPWLAPDVQQHSELLQLRVQAHARHAAQQSAQQQGAQRQQRATAPGPRSAAVIVHRRGSAARSGARATPAAGDRAYTAPGVSGGSTAPAPSPMFVPTGAVPAAPSAADHALHGRSQGTGMQDRAACMDHGGRGGPSSSSSSAQPQRSLPGGAASRHAGGGSDAGGTGSSTDGLAGAGRVAQRQQLPGPVECASQIVPGPDPAGHEGRGPFTMYSSSFSADRDDASRDDGVVDDQYAPGALVILGLMGGMQARMLGGREGAEPAALAVG